MSRLGGLLDELEVTQADFARGIDRSRTLVSRLVSGEAQPSKETIDNALAFLSMRAARQITYEEAFGAPSDVVDHEPTPAGARS